MSTKQSAEAAGLGAEDDDAGSEIDVAMLPRLTEAEAARLTTKIQRRLDMIADSIEMVVPMIAEARNGNAHTALGYQSWTAYVADKFGGTLARLGKSERLPFVELLAEQGMSTRAIASVVGVSKDTVSRDLRAGVSDETPDHGDAEEPVDILVMADATKDEFEAALTEARSEDDLSRENVISILSKNTISKAPAKNVTGMDGKTYPAGKVKATPAAPAEPDPATAAATEADDSYSTGYVETLDLVITHHEAEAICDRWEFGRELRAMRDENGSLPAGFLAELVRATGKSRVELRYRERLAERYPDEETLGAAIERFASWDAFIRGDLKREYRA